MKKSLTPITILITLSLLGLMLVQVSWIKNATLIQEGKYRNDLELSFQGIKVGLKEAIAKQVGYNPGLIDWESDNPAVMEFLWSAVKMVPQEEVHEIIEKELHKHTIDLPFEYKIQGPLPWILASSDGFKEGRGSSYYLWPLSYNFAYVFELYIYQPKNYILRRTWWMILAAILFSGIIISTFFITFRRVLQQRKLSEMKTDFINNMTHEFKTPMATISLASDALGLDKVKDNRTQLNYYLNIIREENERMHKQVEKILQTTREGEGAIKVNPVEINVHEVIKNAVANCVLRLENEEGLIDQFLKAKKPLIYADEVHFTNIINNLLDNAVKYSQTPRHIIIDTSDGRNKSLIIRIQDNGIGMDRSTIGHIFDKFYRAHTGDLHNVKGFGLGLSYVKSVVEAHSARIKVDSVPGKGSTFTLEFPMPLKNLTKKKRSRNKREL